MTQVFEAKDVLPEDIVEVRAGKQDDLLDVDKESFGEITLDYLESFREILCVKGNIGLVFCQLKYFWSLHFSFETISSVMF